MSKTNQRLLMEKYGIDIDDPEFQRKLLATGRTVEDLIAELIEREDQAQAALPGGKPGIGL